MSRACWASILIAGCLGRAAAHDIPNARVDRSTQATVVPGRLLVDYEVSLSELTLTQDLRSLIGTLPGADRETWFRRYGEVTGPLNARGFLASVDGTPIELAYAGHDLTVEDHPRYVFHLEAPIPPGGRLVLHDTNYLASEGTSRLAIRGRDGAVVRGDDLPPDVETIEIRPVWMLGDEEEERTRRVVVEYELPARPAESPERPPTPGPPPEAQAAPTPRGGLSGLLDRVAGLSPLVAGLLAFGLGAIHAVQPGHGKVLVAAAVVGEGGAWWRGIVLALAATAAHTASVALVAAGLWLTRSARYGDIDRALAQASGFAIAAIGLWRVGRHLGGYGEHAEHGPRTSAGGRGMIGLGLAAGVVPCWDAIGLIVVAEAVGRLALGLALLVAFGLGMAAVLVAVGSAAGRVRRIVADRGGDSARWERRLGLIGGLILATIGILLFEGARA